MIEGQFLNGDQVMKTCLYLCTYTVKFSKCKNIFKLTTDHVVVRINQGICSFGDSDVVDRSFVFAEILCSKISPILKLLARRLTVSLNVLPRPVPRGHILSIRNVTRKKLIWLVSTHVSTKRELLTIENLLRRNEERTSGLRRKLTLRKVMLQYAETNSPRK